MATASEEDSGDAPPKKVALAMDRLGQAARLIADVRLGADRVLEALLAAEDPRQARHSWQLVAKVEASMRKHFNDLRTLGRQLEESGVLNESLRSRGDSWGLHMPLVCPDGAVVAYAWKRQLAGQAGASAVDRTRLALKAFTDQKRRFFPHLEDESANQNGRYDFGVPKRQCVPQVLVDSHTAGQSDDKTLFDILSNFEKETPYVKVSTYQRLDWFRRASSLTEVNPVDSNQKQNPYFKPAGSSGSTSMDQAAILELFVPFVFRAVVSLHPAGSTNPDSVAFFSPDEGGSYVHARGFSLHHVYKHIKEHADEALQYFISMKSDSALPSLLHWVSSYHTLFAKSCSKCGRLIVIDKSVGLLLPPVYRPYQQSSVASHTVSQSTLLTKDQTSEQTSAYHIGCYPDEML